jgi:hypothetical protein
MRIVMPLVVLLMAVPLMPEGRTIAAPSARQESSSGPKRSNRKPKDSVRGTIEEAIHALEGYDCETVAVDFLSPIRRAAIPDLDAYRQQRRCSQQDKGNLDEVLLVLRLARWAKPEYRGVTAVINLEGVGLRIEKVTLIRYVDGKWYFNGL